MTAENRDDASPPANPDARASYHQGETALSNPNTSSDPPRLSDDPSPRWVGRTLGKYRITGFLGQGGMGVVLKGHDPLIDREVAIKVLADHLSNDLSALGRFLAEARSVGKLNHPNVVAIYEICQEDKSYYLVLEYVSGGSLSDRLDKLGPLGVLEASRAILDASKGLAAAHAAGVIHRDIKPANFMRAADGTVKIADFGLAKAADAGRHFTQTGMVIGTPSFMSPEQCEGKPLDFRTDLYSLGATYFTLLTGKHPYEDTESITQMMYQHCHGPTLDPRSVIPTIPEACARIIARATAKAPADRYPSAEAMGADLQAVVGALSGQIPIALPSQSDTVPPMLSAPPGPTTSGRRFLPWAFAGFCLVALLGVALLAWRPWQHTPPGPVAGESVKVGVLHSLSGTMSSSEAPVVDAVQFAIDEINREGGVLGRPVKAVVADGRSDEATFAREAERLIVQEKVSAVFGCWTSASRKTVKPLVEKHDHLLLYPVQFEGLELSPCIVYLGPAPNQQIIPAVEWARTTHNKKKFFLIGSDYVFPHAAHAIVKDHLRDSGAEIVGEAYVPLGSQKLEAAVAAIVRARPDMILNTINGDSNIAFFRELRDANIKAAETPTLSFSIDKLGLRSLNPADLEGDYAAWPYFEMVDTPENVEFVKRFQEEYPHRGLTDPMVSAYIGVKLWARAANEAESLEPKKVRRTLLNQRVKGPAGEVRIDPDTQYCELTPRIGQLQADGSIKVIWTAPELVRPDPYPKSRKAERWQAFLHDLYTGWGNRWAAPEMDQPK